MTQSKKALVVGLGIAGISTAIGLRDAGWTPVIIERAASRRTGGYFVGIFPDGKKALTRLGADAYISDRQSPTANSWHIGYDDKQHHGGGFTDRPGGPYAVVRGDIEQALWTRMQGTDEQPSTQPVEIRYNTSPVNIVEEADGVTVTLHDRSTGQDYTEKFDLLVGADGLRSTVRSLAFGPHEKYIRQWNAVICAFSMDEQVPGYAPDDSITKARSKKATWVFSFKDRTPTTLLTYRTKEVDAQFKKPAVEVLREVYKDDNHPATLHALKQLESTDDFLFDSVNQVRMPKWHTNRVVLVGDAAWCMNLYSGMGSTAGMLGGADLADALKAHPDDLTAALNMWEKGLRPFITRHSYQARLTQQLFVPSGPIATGIRSAVVRPMSIKSARKAKKSMAAAAENKEFAKIG